MRINYLTFAPVWLCFYDFVYSIVGIMTNLGMIAIPSLHVQFSLLLCEYISKYVLLNENAKVKMLFNKSMFFSRILQTQVILSILTNFLCFRPFILRISVEKLEATNIFGGNVDCLHCKTTSGRKCDLLTRTSNLDRHVEKHELAHTTDTESLLHPYLAYCHK